jgi:hypothetical protein
MDLVGRQHMGGDGVDQRPQREGRLADPARQRRAPELDPAAGPGRPRSIGSSGEGA